MSVEVVGGHDRRELRHEEHARQVGLRLSDASVLGVLGMHRSGTSLVAGLIAAAGVHAGDSSQLFGPDRHNETGYFEHRAVVELNDGILSAAGGSWWSPPDPSALSPKPAWVEQARSTASALGLLGQERLSVVKDPRFSLTWPVWTVALRRNVFPVLVVREPSEVARSLWLRDDMPLPVGAALWEHYMAALMRSLGDQEVQLVHYSAIVRRPDEALRWLAQLLESAGVDNAFQRAERACDDVLKSDSAMRASDDDFSRAVLSRYQAEIWEALAAVPNGTTIRTAELVADIHLSEPARDVLSRYGARTRLILSQEEKVDRLADAAEQQRKTIRTLQDSEAAARLRLDELESERARLAQQVSEGEVAKERAQRAEMVEGELRARHTELEEELRASAARIEKLDNRRRADRALFKRERTNSRELKRLLRAEQTSREGLRRELAQQRDALVAGAERIAYLDVSLVQLKAVAAEAAHAQQAALTDRERAIGELESYRAELSRAESEQVQALRGEIHRLGTDLHLMHQSWTWRLGRALVGPFSWLRHLAARKSDG